jgi:hypothetical protein
MSWRKWVYDRLPTKLTDSVEYDVGALVGDDARAHRLSWLTLWHASLASLFASLLARQLEALRQHGVQPSVRRAVATRLTDAIRFSVGAGRPTAVRN